MNASSKAYLFTLRHMAQLALDAKDAIERRDRDALADVLALSWAANQRVHPSTTNEEVEEILAATRAHFRGVKLLGAGGGGYALFLSPDLRRGRGGARRAAPAIRERARAARRLLAEHVRAGGFGLVGSFARGAPRARQEDPDGFRFRKGPAPQDRPAHEARRAEEPPGEGRQRRLRPLGEPGADRRPHAALLALRPRPAAEPLPAGAAGGELRLQRRRHRVERQGLPGGPRRGQRPQELLRGGGERQRRRQLPLLGPPRRDAGDRGPRHQRLRHAPHRARGRLDLRRSSARSGRTRRPPRATPPRRSRRPGSRGRRTS